MDLAPFVLQTRSHVARLPVRANWTHQARLQHARELLKSSAFEQKIRGPSVLAAAKACQLVLNLPYGAPALAEFRAGHGLALSRFAVELASWEGSASTLALPRPSRVLIAAWHFPQLPTLLAFARQIHALLLVAQDAEWLDALRAAGCTLNFVSRVAAVTLARQMQEGRVVATTLDHVHPGTRCEHGRLLGRAVQTPAGVLELAIRYQYLIAFIAPRGEEVEIVHTTEAAGKTAGELVQLYNGWLESEIRRAPQDWLMWGALPIASQSN